MSLKKLVESTNQKLDELNLPPKTINMDPRKMDKDPRFGREEGQNNWGSEYPGEEPDTFGGDESTHALDRMQKAPDFNNEMSREEAKELRAWVEDMKAQGIKIPESIFNKFPTVFNRVGVFK
jgi:hypothetical protein